MGFPLDYLDPHKKTNPNTELWNCLSYKRFRMFLNKSYILVLRMTTQGMIHVTVNVLHKDLKRNGFDYDITTLRTPASSQLPEFDTVR